MKPVLVAMEGLCCTGKTTTAGHLADAIGAIQAPTVPDAYTEVRRRFRSVDELDARFLCFLSAVALADCRIRRHLDAGSSVVVESHMARTIAYHRGMGSRADVRLPGLRMPDITYRLTCAADERDRRTRLRGGPRDLWDTLAAGHEAAIIGEYRRFPAHIIDTTARTPRQVVDAVLHHQIDGGCRCDHPQSLAGHQNLLSAVPRRTGPAGHPHGLRGRRIRR